MNVPRIVGFIIILMTLMVGIGSNLPSMIDPPSLILVVGSVVGMLLLGGHNIGGMVTAVFSNSAEESELKAAIHGYRMGRHYCTAAGAVCLAVGSIVVLKSLGDPASIGPGLALALLGTLYALLLGFVLFLGLQSGLEKRLAEPVDASIVSASVLALIFTTVMTAAAFAVISAALPAN